MRVKKRPVRAKIYCSAEGVRDVEEQKDEWAASAAACEMTNPGNRTARTSDKEDPGHSGLKLTLDPTSAAEQQQNSERATGAMTAAEEGTGWITHKCLGKLRAPSTKLNRLILTPRHFLNMAFPGIELRGMILQTVLIKDGSLVQDVDGVCSIPRFHPGPSPASEPNPYAVLHLSTTAASAIVGCRIKQIQAKSPYLPKIYALTCAANYHVAPSGPKTIVASEQAPPVAGSAAAGSAHVAAAHAQLTPLPAPGEPLSSQLKSTPAEQIAALQPSALPRSNAATTAPAAACTQHPSQNQQLPGSEMPHNLLTSNRTHLGDKEPHLLLQTKQLPVPKRRRNADKNADKNATGVRAAHAAGLPSAAACVEPSAEFDSTLPNQARQQQHVISSTAIERHQQPITSQRMEGQPQAAAAEDLLATAPVAAKSAHEAVMETAVVPIAPVCIAHQEAPAMEAVMQAAAAAVQLPPELPPGGSGSVKAEETTTASGAATGGLWLPGLQGTVPQLAPPVNDKRDVIVILDSDGVDDEDVQHSVKQQQKLHGHSSRQLAISDSGAGLEAAQQQGGLTGWLKRGWENRVAAADGTLVTATKQACLAETANMQQQTAGQEPAVELERIRTAAAIGTDIDKVTPQVQTPPQAAAQAVAAAVLASSTAAIAWSHAAPSPQAAPVAETVADVPPVTQAALAVAATPSSATETLNAAAPATTILPANFILTDCSSDILSAGRQLTELLDHLHAPDHQVMQLNDYIISLSHQSGDDSRVVRFWYDYSQIRLWVRRRNNEMCRRLIQQMLGH